MDDMLILESVLTKTGDIMTAVRPEQASLRTPCPDYDVRNLTDHMAGWAQVFASAANGEKFEGDPSAYDGTDAAATFRGAAERMLAGWRAGGVDRSVPLSGDVPGPVALNMTVMEYLTHGWDLATATGQPIPYSDAEAAEVLDRAKRTLPDNLRGNAFGPPLEVPGDAPAIDRVIAFMGRPPVPAG